MVRLFGRQTEQRKKEGSFPGFSDERYPTLGRAQYFASMMDNMFKVQKIGGSVMRVQRGARYLSIGVRLADPFKIEDATRLANPLALQVRCKAVIVSRGVPGLVTYQFELPMALWQKYDGRHVRGLAVGLAENKRQIEYRFEPPHSGVFGTTDSGKSEMLRRVMVNLMKEHRPDQLGLIVVDPHRDFSDDLNGCLHLMLPVAVEKEEIDQAFLLAGKELRDRKEAGVRHGHRKIVVIIDEAAMALGMEQVWYETCRQLAGQARKFGMHLILSTQRPSGMADIVNLLNNRWAGMVDNAQTSALVTGHAGLNCHRLTGHGDFMHVAGPLAERFQVALVSQDELDRLPRGEVSVPVMDDDDVIYPERLGPGRPPTQIEPRVIARYLDAGPDQVTRSEADDNFGLKRYAHVAHRDFAMDLLEELGRLGLVLQRAGAGG